MNSDDLNSTEIQKRYNIDKSEVWQRGPIEGVPGLLQPVAHALLQSIEDVEACLNNFSSDLLWIKPLDMASVGFHLQHLTGVVDRLFTYARGERLLDDQLNALASEGKPPFDGCLAQHLIAKFKTQVGKAITQLKTTNETTLTEVRGVGRKQIPSTVIGLLFHAAEHAQRHVGQLLVTSKLVSEYSKSIGQ
ncbi:DinB family protein [Fulvivirgaceae bacterium PWU20]|uniref:DinB family protein n=2 Tax=Chryseosolibacter indicus TaxID=2782351 RepID=A0ABS5VK28_9BACT|nr:DinB family protein [Chryseosolibacter indicus]MBT1701788.1 DinB family protein [Chryseosolibacter indicus]